VLLLSLGAYRDSCQIAFIFKKVHKPRAEYWVPVFYPVGPRSFYGDPDRKKL
jgi:hypothetical protein